MNYSNYTKRDKDAVEYCNIGTNIGGESWFFHTDKVGDPIIQYPEQISASAECIDALYSLWTLRGRKKFIEEMSEPLNKNEKKKFIFVSKKFFVGKDYSNAYESFIFEFAKSVMLDYEEAVSDLCNSKFNKNSKCSGLDDFKKSVDLMESAKFSGAGSKEAKAFNDRIGTWTIERHGTSRFTSDRKYVTPIDFFLDAKKGVVTKTNLINMFDDIAISVDKTEYTKIDSGWNIMAVLTMFLYYFENMNDKKRSDLILGFAQKTYKEKSLSFLKETKPFMSKKKAATINEDKPTDDVLYCESPFIVYWYADYMERKTGKFPALFTSEFARQKFIESFIDSFSRGTVSDEMLEKFKECFEEKMLVGSAKNNRNFMTYVYLIGYCKGLYGVSDIVDYFSQNFDAFGELIKEYSATARDKSEYSSRYGKIRDAGLGDQFKYDDYELIASMAKNYALDRTHKDCLEFIIKYINYAMPSDKIICILIESFMYGAVSTLNDGSEPGGDFEKQDNRVVYGKTDFLQDIEPIASDWTKNKILKYVLE